MDLKLDSKIEWRIIPSFDSYEVSEYGQVRRIKLGINGKGAGTFIGKVMKPYVREDGYDMYILRKNNKSFHKKAHQLVCETFISPKPEDKTEVCHADGTRTNNHWTNLRWGTSKENKSDMVAHGTRLCGEKSGNAKLRVEDVVEIKKLASAGMLHRVIAEKYGVRQPAISRIVSGERWKHHV